MKSPVLRFSFVLVVVLFLLSTFVFAKGKPSRIYSWSVAISGENLQPVDGSTYTVRTSSGSAHSEFRFEALAPDSKVQLIEMSDFLCEPNYDCGKIFDAIGIDHDGTIEQPDGDTYKRVEFQVFLSYLDFENMEVGDSWTEEMSPYNGVGFVIDESNPSDNKNYIWGNIQGAITIKRTNSDTWLIQCDGTSVDLKELAAETEIVCKPSGKGCKEVVLWPSEVAYGTAGPMVFELTFTRSAH